MQQQLQQQSQLARQAQQAASDASPLAYETYADGGPAFPSAQPTRFVPQSLQAAQQAQQAQQPVMWDAQQQQQYAAPVGYVSQPGRGGGVAEGQEASTHASLHAGHAGRVHAQLHALEPHTHMGYSPPGFGPPGVVHEPSQELPPRPPPPPYPPPPAPLPPAATASHQSEGGRDDEGKQACQSNSANASAAQAPEAPEAEQQQSESMHARVSPQHVRRASHSGAQQRTLRVDVPQHTTTQPGACADSAAADGVSDRGGSFEQSIVAASVCESSAHMGRVSPSAVRQRPHIPITPNSSRKWECSAEPSPDARRCVRM